MFEMSLTVHFGIILNRFHVRNNAAYVLYVGSSLGFETDQLFSLGTAYEVLYFYFPPTLLMTFFSVKDRRCASFNKLVKDWECAHVCHSDPSFPLK